MKKTANNGALTLPHGVTLTTTGLVCKRDLSSNEWKTLGETLVLCRESIQWALGDWMCDGCHRYGERKAIAIAKGIPYAYHTLENLARVARAFEHSRRREGLYWSHHDEVAALEPSEQDLWLDRAIRENWSSKQLRQKITEDGFDHSPEDDLEKYVDWLDNAMQVIATKLYDKVAPWESNELGTYLKGQPDALWSLVAVVGKAKIFIVETDQFLQGLLVEATP